MGNQNAKAETVIPNTLIPRPQQIFYETEFNTNVNFYEVLKVEQGASVQQIRKQYYTLARKWHPDKNPGDAHAHQRFQMLSRAYQVLVTPELRAKYDKHGSTALDVDFMDGGAFFSALFGDNAFEHLIGELILSTVARCSGEISKIELKRIQSERVDKLAAQLKIMLNIYQSGNFNSFKESLHNQAQIMKQAPFGDVMLYAIAKLYDLQADIYKGEFFGVAIARIKEQGEHIRTHLSAVGAVMRMLNAQQRLEKFRRRQGDFGVNKEDEAEKHEEDENWKPQNDTESAEASVAAQNAKEQAKLDTQALQAMIEAMWAANVLDIQETVKAVCKKTFDEMPEGERRMCATALKLAADIFLASVPQPPPLDDKDPRVRLNEAMQRAADKEKEEAPTAAEAKTNEEPVPSEMPAASPEVVISE